MMRPHRHSHPFTPALSKAAWLGVLFFFLFTLAACGGEAAEPTPTLDPVAAAGEVVFRRECAACHTITGSTVVVGPPLMGIAGRAAARVPGQDAQSYLLTSIMRPDEYIVEGFENTMPTNFGRKLTGEEIDALVAYLLTLE